MGLGNSEAIYILISCCKTFAIVISGKEDPMLIGVNYLDKSLNPEHYLVINLTTSLHQITVSKNILVEAISV